MIIKHLESQRGQRTSEFTAWTNMIQRCEDHNHVSFKNYGGRGIRVCSRWKASYKNFLADMGRKPTPQRSLDRKDTNKNYGSDNCRWATILEQRYNRRDGLLVMLTIDGKTQSIAQWARESQLKYGTLYDRLKRGWSQKDAVYRRLR